jgi:hypothetical protein
MFFGTPGQLLRPIHSLLKESFHFCAKASVGERLRGELMHRDH